jgi:uncharacterized cofD-like protein
MFQSGPAWAEAPDPHRLTAIVTVADDGGSSGRLRREHGVLPPGDVRNCLLALADGAPVMTRLFEFRFDGQGETTGHSLGNLILTALSRIGNGFGDAVEHGANMLAIRGQVFPSSLDDVRLYAEFVDGSSVEGESKIAQVRRPIRRVCLKPPDARAVPQALSAIETADLVVIGPGSLYTSLIPVLLVRDIAEAITQSHARVVLVANLMTEPGETDGYTAVDHLTAIRRHVPDLRIHDVLVNTAPIADELRRGYAAGGACPIRPAPKAIRAAGSRAVECDLLRQDAKIRHDPTKLARALLEFEPLAADADHD